VRKRKRNRKEAAGRADILLLILLFPFLGACPAKPPPDSGSPIHLFVPPDSVHHRPRFCFSYEKARDVQDLRQQEKLDLLLDGAETDMDIGRRLMHWTSKQWEAGRPDPYPPPDARIILRDIRSGFTGGFCAQYAAVFVQAAASFGIPARFVTLLGHEVAELWLRDERRWVLFDPTSDLQILDSEERALNAGEVHAALQDGTKLHFSPGHHCRLDIDGYTRRFEHFAVWIRNDLRAHPLNFGDFDRYRLWFDPEGNLSIPLQSLKTPFLEDLYAPPVSAEKHQGPGPGKEAPQTH